MAPDPQLLESLIVPRTQAPGSHMLPWDVRASDTSGMPGSEKLGSLLDIGTSPFIICDDKVIKFGTNLPKKQNLGAFPIITSISVICLLMFLESGEERMWS